MRNKLLKLNIHMFDANTNVTSDSGLSPEMKTFYRTELIRLAEPELAHDLFGQKKPIPKNNGKTVEFRKYSSLPKALKPLTEGVTPNGQKLEVTKVEATVAQYGGYVTLSDMLIMSAIDNNIMEATELIASQAGRTLDTITREVLVGGTNVQFADGSVDARYKLVGGELTGNHVLKVDSIKRGVRALKHVNAKKINGYFCSIINPDCSYDIMNDPEWKYPHQYVDTDNIYEGEIGMIAGVRFVESTEAKIFHAENLTEEERDLSVKTATTGAASATLAVKEAISSDEATALEDRKVLIGTSIYEIQSAAAGAAGSATITIDKEIEVAANTVIYPGEAGAKGRDVYATLVVGKDAYGVTEIEGGGLEHIVKPLGSGEDPLNQRATVGWKATKVAERLVEEYMIRIETASTFEGGAN